MITDAAGSTPDFHVSDKAEIKTPSEFEVIKSLPSQPIRERKEAQQISPVQTSPVEKVISQQLIEKSANQLQRSTLNNFDVEFERYV